MENQNQKKQTKLELKIERWKRTIEKLNQKREKEELTAWEIFSLERTQTALINGLKYLNMSKEDRDKMNAERRRIKDERDIQNPESRKKRLAAQKIIHARAVERGRLLTLENAKKTNSDSKKIISKQIKNSKLNITSVIVPNSDNIENNSNSNRLIKWNVEEYDSETQSCGNSHCPSSDSEEVNYQSAVLKEENEIISFVTTSKTPQEKDDKPSSTVSESQPKKQSWKIKFPSKFQRCFQTLLQDNNDDCDSVSASASSQLKQQNYTNFAGNNSSKAYQKSLVRESVIQGKVAAACTNSQTYDDAYAKHCESVDRAKKKFQQLLNPDSHTLYQSNLLLTGQTFSGENNAQSADQLSQNLVNSKPQFS